MTTGVPGRGPRRWLLLALGVPGALAILVAFGVDLIRPGTPGLGLHQLLLALLGALLLAIGVIAGTDRGARWFRAGAWRESLGGTPATAGSVFLTAVFVGLLAGLAEAAAGGLRMLAVHEAFIGVGTDVIWMAPLADLILLGGVGLILAAIVALVPRPVPFRPFFFGLCFLGVYTALLAAPLAGRIQGYGLLVLAAGLTISLMRLGLARRFARTRAAAGMAVLAVVLVFVAWSVVAGRLVLRERARVAALGTPADGAPNVLFIILDTVRADALSLYGYDRRTTPFLDSLSHHGVVFDNAIATAPWTLPSHASMFTGHYPDEMSADWDVPFEGEFPTLAEILGRAGYVSGGFAANDIYAAAESGLDHGFVHYAGRVRSFGEILRNGVLTRRLIDQIRSRTGNYQRLGRKSATDVNAEAMRWLDRVRGLPYFAFLNYFDTHDPYLAPAPFDTMFGPVRPRANPTFKPAWTWKPDEIRAERDAYDRSLAYLDDSLSRLFAALEAGGHLTNTLVIVTSDHGEHFGEHGQVNHGRTLYLPVLHVPLLIVFSGQVPEETRIATRVSLRDIPATVLDLAGAAPAAAVPGTSLRAHWSGDSVTSAPIRSQVRKALRLNGDFPTAKGDVRSVIVDGYHYIAITDGTEELYDLTKDPGENDDLVGKPGSEPILERLRGLIEVVPAGNNPARVPGR